MDIKTLKGFRDFLPEEAKKRAYALDILRRVFESYGFEPLETPTLEYEEILTGKYGEEGDKLMYRFEDNGQRKVAMRYDQTVPLARVAAQYQNDLPLPFKRFQIQNVFRAENTQKGRYREFLQVDADIIGSNSTLADAEVIKLAIDAYSKLGFKNFKILVNDRKNFSDLSKNGILKAEDLPKAIRSIDKIKKIGREGVVEDLVKAGFENDFALNILQTFEGLNPTDNLNKILEILRNNDVDMNKIEFSPTLARGLDYYTGLIMEIESPDYPVGSLGGGGRYDNLAGIFAGKEIPAVGFAVGFDRTIEAMDELGLFPESLNKTQILVTSTGTNASEIANQLRNQGIISDLYVDEKNLDKQLKYADKKQIPFVLIIEGQKLTLKNMQTGEKKDITLQELPNALR